MTNDKTKDDSAHLRFDYNLTECKALMEKIREKISVMEAKQKKDSRNWSWAATAYYVRELFVIGSCYSPHKGLSFLSFQCSCQSF